MGLCLTLCSIDEDNLLKVLIDPPLVWRVIAPEDPEAFERARLRPGLLGKIFGGRPAPAPELVLGAHEGQTVDLDKAWHGIHYLLTGTADGGDGPASFLLAGGESIGDIEVGYGPARALTAAQVQAFHQALSSITPEDLRSRFDPAEMQALKIYPDIWDRDPTEDDTLGYCLDHFAVLRTFVAATAAKGQALVIVLT